MVRELYRFPRLNDTDQVLCLDTHHECWFIRSTFAGVVSDITITPATANAIIQYAQLEEAIMMRTGQ